MAFTIKELDGDTWDTFAELANKHRHLRWVLVHRVPRRGQRARPRSAARSLSRSLGLDLLVSAQPL